MLLSQTNSRASPNLFSSVAYYEQTSFSTVEPIIYAVKWANWTESTKPGTFRHRKITDSDLSRYCCFDPSLTQPPRISAYFKSVTMPVPLFSPARFYAQYNAGRIPPFLLNAMFSLSCRFATSPLILDLANGDLVMLAHAFYQKSSRELDLRESMCLPVTIPEVKAACLLAHYHYTYLPTREAVSQWSRAVRWAYVCGLHRVDSPRLPRDSDDTEVDAEEKRCLWWAIWAMDTFCSQMSHLPAGIDDQITTTRLPTCFLSNEGIGVFPPSTGRTLDDWRGKDWYNLRIGESPQTRIQLVRLSATALAKELDCIMKLEQARPEVDVQSRIAQFEAKWESLTSSLPAWFFSPGFSKGDGTSVGHRMRLEALHLVFIVGLMSGTPPMKPLMLDSDTSASPQRASETFEFRWSNSLSYALRIAALYRHGDWSDERFLEGDPVTLYPILWTASSFLCLGLMRTGPVDATEKLALIDALDVVMIQLRLASRCWGVTGMFLSSLQQLRGLTYLRLDMGTLFEVVRRLYCPMKQEPGDGDGDEPERHSERQENLETPDGEMNSSTAGSLDLLPTPSVWSAGENALATEKWFNGEQHKLESGWQDTDGLPHLSIM
ncbi:fungal specific transcription factor [Colletotrichum plurivorum]|uniref:Fungal specific transcription factor n=1 Tax=Colletotrichum plurivorum TaxID=2175906 RepID=A0A8H6JFE8_9PEZI|nr:fungal specific transcription factor [Colletotrichum plurivorum]